MNLWYSIVFHGLPPYHSCQKLGNFQPKMIQEPIIKHSFVQINRSYVHLVNYGSGESVFKLQSDGGSSEAEGCLQSAKISPKSLNRNGDADKKDPETKDENSTKLGQKNRLIIFIPGNPGVLGVYHDFLKRIFNLRPWSNSKLKKTTIIAIGHNDFDHPDHVDYRAEERICIEETELNFVERAISHKYEPHHIELQVINKLVILHKIIKLYQSHELYFVGHSIGCYIILRLLQDRQISSIHNGSILLNPALENLALTPKGTTIDRIFSFKLDLLMHSVAYVIDNLLPKQLKLSLTKLLCSDEFIKSSSDMVIESVMQLACQKTLSALIKMAKSELAVVKDINEDLLIEPHVDKLELVFAEKDHWVNEAFRVKLCNRRILRGVTVVPALHAFVMDHHDSMEYANIVSERLSLFMKD